MKNITPFADFIRNASPDEKERVYLDVMDKATIKQLQFGTPTFIKEEENALLTTNSDKYLK